MRVVGRIDPRVRFVFLVMYFVVALQARQAPVLGACFVIACASAGALGIGVKAAVRLLRPLVPILFVTVLMQVLYVKTGHEVFSLGAFAVTQDALLESARMLVCLASVMLMSAAFMRCTSTEELVSTLKWLLKPLRCLGVQTGAFVLSLSIAFRFVPVLVEEFKSLKRSQESRLMAFDGTVRQRLRAYTGLFGPLVRSSFRRADALAEAFVSRCFKG